MTKPPVGKGAAWGMPSGRPTINPALDEDTAVALADFLHAHGITASGLVEAFGRAATSGDEPAWLRRLIKQARAIDTQRRSRRRD